MHPKEDEKKEDLKEVKENELNAPEDQQERKVSLQDRYSDDPVPVPVLLNQDKTSVFSLPHLNRDSHLNDTPPSCAEMFVVFASWIMIVMFFPFSLCLGFKVINQYERVIILRNGRVRQRRAYGPGLIFHLPCVDILNYCDLRTMCYTVPAQEVLTKDSLSVFVDAVMFYKISNPMQAVISVADYSAATQLLAATILRNAIGTRLLTELLAERRNISIEVFDQMKCNTTAWGVTVVRVEIKDICLPLQLQKAMAAEAESSRLANAKIIVAKAEIEATKSLEKATAVLSDNPYSMQLRYLQSLHTISGDKMHTYVIPISPGLFGQMFK